MVAGARILGGLVLDREAVDGGDVVACHGPLESVSGECRVGDRW